MDIPNNSSQEVTQMNTKAETSSKYWCFICEEEFSNSKMEIEEVFCPKCNSISELIEEDNNPKEFKAYDPQREAPQSTNSQNPQIHPNIPPQGNNTQNQNPLFGQSPFQINSQPISINGFDSFQQITLPNLFGTVISELQNIISPNPNPQNTQQGSQTNSNPSTNSSPFNPFISMIGNFASNLMRGGNIFEDINSMMIEQFLRNDPNVYGPPPASQDIIAKLQESKFASGECVQKDCLICQEDYKEEDVLLNLPCQHSFHKACVVEWLTRHNSCPACRKTLTVESIKAGEQS